MRLPDFQYTEPGSVEEASLFLTEHDRESKVMGGGTDMLPSMKQKIFRPRYVVSLGNIPNLDRIEFDKESGLRLGAMVRLRSIETDPMILKRYPIIGEAAGAVGSVQVRHMGRVGGNLCLDTRCYYYNQSDFWRKCRPTCIKMGGETCNAIGGGNKCFAVHSSDLAPALMALGASARLLSAQGERTIPLGDLYSGDGVKPLAMNPEEILIGVEVPALSEDTKAVYYKYRIRRAVDFPIASLAGMFEMDRQEKVCRRARVVIGAVGTRPQEINEIGELLEGKRIDGTIIEKASELAHKAAKPIANAAGSPGHRKWMIKVFLKKALEAARGNSA